MIEEQLRSELDRVNEQFNRLVEVSERAIGFAKELTKTVSSLEQRAKEVEAQVYPLIEFSKTMHPILVKIHRQGFTEEVKNELFAIATKLSVGSR